MALNPSELFEGLNLSQKQAATTIDRPVLVVAGPGTGKTMTIIRRIGYFVHQGVKPESILAITFTNRAAREMKERAAVLLGDAASGIFIGTFHVLGVRIIRETGNEEFAICGRDEQIELLKRLTNGSAKKAQQAAEAISRIKNFLIQEDDISGIYDQYQAALRQQNAYDFDDLIRVPIELLKDEAVARRWHERFRHIIVDEYQDINPGQYRLLKALSGEGGNVCAVGDSDQAIYAFRGADIGNFLNFERDFAGAARVTLTQNYRSTLTILSAASSVVRNNKKRIDKELCGTKENGRAISIVSVPDERAEASGIIQEIEVRMGGTSHSQIRQMGPGERASDQSYKFSDFAVMYRTNAQAKALEDAFAASGIPYQVIGKRSSGQRKEIEETVAFLQALAHPDPVEARPREAKKTIEEKLLSEADFFDPRADAVTLMTMHTAKGLEFRVVFIAGCEDGLVPCTIMKDGADIEEERRVFYVGITRAKEELFLIHSRKRFVYGQSLEQKSCPFLPEIPEGLKEYALIPDRIRKQKPEDKQMGLF